MMSMHLQMALIIAASITLIFVVYVIVRHRMNVKYAIIWIVWTLAVLIIGLFPKIADSFSSLLSIATPVNTIFLAMLFLLYIISFYAYLKISLQEQKILDLTYSVAKLNKRIDDLVNDTHNKER